MRSALALGITTLLCGCAATGVRYADDPANLAPVSAQSARLTIFRPSESVQYATRSASLRLDGSHFGGLSIGGFRLAEVPPGFHTLQVDMWDAPGRCELSFEIAQGTVAYFEVAPRLANFAAGTPGALVPPTTPVGLLVGGATMLTGMAAESSGKQCGGAFSIVQVEPSAALPKLVELRASK